MGSSESMTLTDPPLLDVRNLKVEFSTGRGTGEAVDGAGFYVESGETLGLVGESGCGKSVTALSIMGLQPKTAEITNGEILFRGKDLVEMAPRERRSYRGIRMAMILQDPMTALNPVLTVGDQLSDPLRIHRNMRGSSLEDRAVELLTLLRIPDPRRRLSSYPHEFSGGMRQRVVGAIALSCEPELLIADEPTTALDVTIQAAYLALLKEIQASTNLAIIFITHDFSVVSRMCDRVAVMYAGQIVETANTTQLFAHARHPYTAALLESVPDLTIDVTRLPAIGGAPPSIYDRKPGCPFSPRCPLRKQLDNPELCTRQRPAFREIVPGQFSACHFAESMRAVL